jgi:transcriptional repressor NrdR
MKCPFCNYLEDKVVNSRVSQDGASIRRRRECLSCEKRFTTYENIVDMALMVVKKDGRREAFDKQKIITGIIKACEKRSVKIEDIDKLVDIIERELQKNYEKEVDSNIIGEFIMKELKIIDQVAYVRFASVYREFKDVNQFKKELNKLLV